MGVLPEIRWFSSNECALGCTLGGSAECHVDENHAISGMLGGSDCIATGGEGYSAAAKGGVSFTAAIGA